MTGLVWWVLHDFMQVRTEFGTGPHPLESWALKLHGLASMISLVVLGTLLPLHVRRGWHSRRNRTSGSGLLAVMLLLTLSGYALYYTSHESIRSLASFGHKWIGLLLPVVISVHIWIGRRTSTSVPPTS